MSDETTPESPPPVRDKTSPGIGMPASLYLEEFGQAIEDAFGETPFHVGSSFEMNGRPTWRDVDVRLILDDERYASDGYGDPEYPHQNAKWVATVKAFSLLGRQMTGLPIDFQIQQRTHANEHYGRATGQHRNGLWSLVRMREKQDAYERGRAAGRDEKTEC